MHLNKRFFILTTLVFLCISCEKELINEEYSNDPVGNFNAFWNEFDRFYGAFDAKKIDWDSLYTVYGASINGQTSDSELYAAMTGLLTELNDGHANLNAQGFGNYRSWSRRNKSYFVDFQTNDMRYVADIYSLIRLRYLRNNYQSDNTSGNTFLYGIIPYEGRSIGYLSIPTFVGTSYPDAFIREAIEDFSDVDAVVLDIRFNGGGATETFVRTMNLFSSEKRLYMKSRFRSGSSHADFTEMENHYTHPNSESFRNKPIAVLVNSFSGSSSDHFLLGLKSQDNVISVGDTTCGAFSAVLERILPNGWVYRLGAQVIFDSTGNYYCDSKGRYLEGIGIAPDFYVPDNYSSIGRLHDLPLDKALAELSIILATK